MTRSSVRKRWSSKPTACSKLDIFAMAITDALLPEYDHEMGTTRRLLDRVPESEFGWKPHEKSMSLGELAGHLARIPTWTGTVIGSTEFDMSAAGVGQTKPVVPASRAALLNEFDTKVAERAPTWRARPTRNCSHRGR